MSFLSFGILSHIHGANASRVVIERLRLSSIYLILYYFYYMPQQKCWSKMELIENINNEVYKEISSCDILYTEDLDQFNQEYLTWTKQVSATCQDRDLSENCMVIGTSAIVDTQIDGAVGMNSGIFNNPFMIWGRYRRRWLRYELPVSFQFHHTQMDGAHAGRFLENLQQEINALR